MSARPVYLRPDVKAEPLIQPMVSYRYPTDVRRFDLCDLPARIDFVLLTHRHEDHTHLEILLQLRARIGTIVVPRSGGGYLHDPSMRLLLEAMGFRSIVEVDEVDELAGIEAERLYGHKELLLAPARDDREVAC